MISGSSALTGFLVSAPLVFGKSFLTGILVSAPVGPIALLALRRVLQGQIILAIMVGLGSAIADTLLGTLALIGLDALDAFLKSAEFWVRLGGGILLIVIGIVLWVYSVPQNLMKVEAQNPFKSLGLGFFLTIFNPVTIAAFLALFSALHLKTVNLPVHMATITIAGVFAGSLAWWSALTFSFYWMRRRFGLGEVQFLNKSISIVLILLGGYTLSYTLKINPYRFVTSYCSGKST